MDADERYTKWHPVSWEQLHKDGRTLARQLAGKGPFTSIIAVTRGGLVPAAIIARELDIRLVETICLSSYAWKSQEAACTVLKGVNGTGAGSLVIDDLVDTGNTAKVVRSLLPDAYFAAVYAKPKGRPFVDAYVTQVSQDTWVLFPWDSGLQYVAPQVKQAENG